MIRVFVAFCVFFFFGLRGVDPPQIVGVGLET